MSLFWHRERLHAGHYFNRIYVLAFGVCFWGVMTALFSGCTSLAQGYVVWGFNGIGLALVIPTGQSLTADYFEEDARGRAFGALYLTGALGALLGTTFATNTGMPARSVPSLSIPLFWKKKIPFSFYERKVR